MKTTIYYFTGTGNSLAAAKKVADVLGETELVPIASLHETKTRIIPRSDRVGIVCPVYDAGIPVIVRDFLGRLDLNAEQYLFGIVTMGGMGVSALHQINSVLVLNHQKKLDAAFAVKMPGNFPPVGIPPVGEKKKQILADADKSLAAIAEKIANKKRVSPQFSPGSSLLRLLLYPPFARNVHGIDKNFSVGEACTSCGTCSEVCPVGNIVMENERPVWQHHCELCCACLHSCPAEAIDLSLMRGTKGRGRYLHPDLTKEDLRVQGKNP